MNRFSFLNQNDKFNRLRTILFNLVVMLPFWAMAQNQPSMVWSNYSGVSAVPFNPATIADNRYRLDINIVGGTFSGYNNYIALTGHTLPWYLSNTPAADYILDDTSKRVWQDPNFQDEYLYERVNDRDKAVFGYSETFLPSALYTIDQKNAVAFTWRVRSMINIDGLGSDLARALYTALEDSTQYLQLLSNPPFSIQQMNWAEYSFGYGRVMYDEDKHFIKAGVNLKLVQGMNAIFLYMDEFDYQIFDEDHLGIPETEVHYGHSDSYEPADLASNGYRFDSKIAPAFDFGVIYEYRPNADDYKYDMDGEYDQWVNNKNKYKFKAGLSVTDLGRIKFNKAEGSNSFIADANIWDISQIDINSIAEFDSVINSKFDKSESDERTFKMQLPTAISAQFDYHVWNDFYVNFTPYWAFVRKNNTSRVHGITSYSITPRYDHQFFGVSMPISYNNYGNTALGLGIRVGPLTVATTDFVPYFNSVNIFGADGYFSLKLPLYRRGKPSDKDGDEVSDKNDRCVEIPGTWQYRGCPDTDNDGISDLDDECPADSGLVEFNGCPDTDLDGIQDRYDECPELPGILAFRGCPDTDGDSIIDPEDLCPELYGSRNFQGCPDTDGDSIIDPEDLCPLHAGPKINQGCPDRDFDGIFDYLDECPEEAGPQENNGCPWPDTDQDGILDKNDRCPNNPGPPENEGCPYADTDEDGVLDKDDNCPNVPGPVENDGCPIIEEEEQEILNTAFADLQFQTGKAVIRDGFDSLDELAELMIKKPEWKLKLAGHTDDVGNDQSNLILSKRRAEAVRDYLVKKEVPKDVIKVEFYGETRPLVPNDSKENRQKNRRVEMEVVFE